MKDIYRSMKAACHHIRRKTSMVPTVGIVLGTGLGGLAREIEVDTEIPYAGIPGFVASTVESHEGRLIIGKLAGTDVVAMHGRFHYYEGYTMREITFPVRVMHELGASKLVISNAAGGMNPEFCLGDLILIRDHINLIGDNPLIGVSEPELGPRFPDMSRPYSRRLMDIAKRTAAELGIVLREGVYAGVAGPSLETAAEYRYLRMIGADMVGMSTVPEAIVGVQMGMEILGMTIISDVCDPDNLNPTSIEEIIAVCSSAEPHMTNIIQNVIRLS